MLFQKNKWPPNVFQNCVYPIEVRCQ